MQRRLGTAAQYSSSPLRYGGLSKLSLTNLRLSSHFFRNASQKYAKIDGKQCRYQEITNKCARRGCGPFVKCQANIEQCPAYCLKVRYESRTRTHERVT